MSNDKTTLKDLRAVTGLTQEDIAKLAGVARQTVTQWEAGSRNIHEDNIKKAAKAYGCSTEEIERYIAKAQSIARAKRKRLRKLKKKFGKDSLE